MKIAIILSVVAALITIFRYRRVGEVEVIGSR